MGTVAGLLVAWSLMKRWGLPIWSIGFAVLLFVIGAVVLVLTGKAEKKRRVGIDFFFSSRRRHTRFDCDWSSDVCSSDLSASPRATAPLERTASAVPAYPRRIRAASRFARRNR